MRLFFAIEITEPVRAASANFQSELKDALPDGAYRWTAPELFHVTLAFLGSVQESDLSPLVRAAASACARYRATQLDFRGMGCFASVRRPQVLWIGGHESATVVNDVGMALYDVADPFAKLDKRETIIPHITIARSKARPSASVVSAVKAAVHASAETDFGRMAVEYISLLESNLKGTGDRYRLLERFSLSARQ